jgi:hypothetical protein
VASGQNDRQTSGRIVSSSQLPPEFKDLESWAGWAHSKMDERRDRRLSSSIEELEAFYGAILPRLEAILNYLTAKDPDGLDPQSKMLMNMAYTLAEIAPAVEQFFEPAISYGYDVTRFEQGVLKG